TIFGVPSQCVHHNVIHPCKLSFSCWLQGGMHATGCGSNKWLFSCCVSVADHKIRNKNIKQMTNMNFKFYKKNELRRRTDDLNQVECGIPKTSENTIQKRIIGGRPAFFAEYPWQAHIRIAEYQCGGVLVSRHHIATAAHCIQQARIRDIVAYLGELDTQNSGFMLEPLASEKHLVSKKVIHPKFQFRITQPDRYDLALLQLATPTTYKDHILPICLPTSTIDLTGKKGIIAGWGKTKANMGHTGTNILQSASVPILSTFECIYWHESKQISVELFDEMLCAGHSDGHQDACLGDSGGPLIIKDKGRFTLVGITSAGFGCGIDHQPGIYHNVQLTSKWIQEIIY
ncbi:Serine proteinase stubble, partial [Pseudolycoriella hygida]